MIPASAAPPQGLYLHLPFCARKCHYCDFVIAVGADSRFKENFFKALDRECAHYRELGGRRIFQTVYWGGGTPSLLEPRECERVLDSLALCAGWEADAEFTFEMNPDDVTPEKLRFLRTMGVNRVSLGVQSLNDALLAGMGRPHDAATALHAMELIRSNGFKNLSADLILKLPGQTLKDVEEAVRACIAAGAVQLVLYDLAVHPRTWFGILRGRGKLDLPGEEAHLELYDAAVALLEEAGFRQYEVVSFAKPGFESKHNLIYWRNLEYLGLGPGAFSYQNKTRYQLAPSVAEYIQKALSGDFTPSDTDSMDAETEKRESFLVGLRLAEGVDISTYAAHLNGVQEEVKKYLEWGWLEMDCNQLKLTRLGRRMAESIFESLS